MKKLISFAFVLCLVAPTRAAEPLSPVLSAMQAELSRAMA